MFSTKGEYAICSLLDINVNYYGEPIKPLEIAYRQDIPLSYLEKILTKLRAAKLIESITGRAGGVIPIKNSNKIKIKSILKAVDENIINFNRSKKNKTEEQKKIDNLIEKLKNTIYSDILSLTLGDL